MEVEVARDEKRCRCRRIASATGGIRADGALDDANRNIESLSFAESIEEARTDRDRILRQQLV